MEISLEETANGVVLPVKAHAGARRNGVTGTHDGALKVAVSQAPEKGKANSAILKTLADVLGLNKNQIDLLSGQTSVHKRFLIRAIAVDQLRERITSILEKLEADAK